MKKLYHAVNRKLETITFANKTKILIFTIFGGTLLIGFLMFISIFALKYDFEVLFRNHTKPLVKLEEIKDIYQVNIKETINAIKDGEITDTEGEEVLLLARQLIQKQWRDYKYEAEERVGGLPEFASNWLRFFLLPGTQNTQNPFESRIIKNIEQKIRSIDRKTGKLIDYLHTNQKQSSQKEIDDLILETNSINIYLSSLITNNLKRAISKKESNDKLFSTSIYMLFLLIGLAFAFVVLVSITIINHFKKLHYSLEENVANKTEALLQLNRSLESRIKREVESSRKKDNIMFQQARLASMGEVLQNIAHQWRQPLGTLMMIIQGLQSKYLSGKLDEKLVEESVDDAIKIGQSMSETLDDFRNFFAPNKVKQSFDILRAIQKAIELSKYQLEKEKIELILHAKAPIRTYGFKNELIHVMLNIINNAKDKLISETEISKKTILIILKQNKTSAVISVIDNGGGIDEEILPKIFDPYFTTKHQSIGTGIGLYMSKQMVETHMGGKIDCQNIRYRFEKHEDFSACAMFTVEIPITHTIPQQGVYT